jgi:energy-coupling factor transporter transmembrane protein EcfT
LFEGLTADSPQIKAIDEWIRLGGRLFFCAGQGAEKFLEKENSPLRPFLPGKFERMTELRDGKPLTTFIAGKRPIFMNGTADAPYIKLPYFTQPQGITIVKEIDNPLVVRCAHGFGTIIYFGGDLSGKPLGTWRDRIQLVQHILQWTTESGRGGTPRSGAMLQLGYNDISGQVRSALDRFDGVRIVPFSIILIILVVYWLIVGPFDWFFVHKILKRPVLTWITFPLWIILFSVLAGLLASGGRPKTATLNELDLVDADSETGGVRLSSWGNLYSPNDARYSLSLDAFELVISKGIQRPALFSWNGLSGSGLGGMAPKTVSPTVWQTGSKQEFAKFQNSSIVSTTPKLIDDVPIQFRATKSFFGQSWSTKPVFSNFINTIFVSKFASKLTDEEGVPIGTLESPELMPAMDDCILVYGRWVQDIGTIEPGQKIEVGKKTQRRELRDLLLPKEVLEDAALRRLSFYNPQSVDLNYIVRVLSLHNILGGYEATGLHHSFQKSLDMSELLSVDRAILIGTVRDSKEASSFGSRIMPRKSGETGRPEPFDGKRLIVFRQSLPVTLTALSPRLKLEQTIYKDDGLAQPLDPAKAKEGRGEYKPGF